MFSCFCFLRRKSTPKTLFKQTQTDLSYWNRTKSPIDLRPTPPPEFKIYHRYPKSSNQNNDEFPRQNPSSVPCKVGNTIHPKQGNRENERPLKGILLNGLPHSFHKRSGIELPVQRNDFFNLIRNDRVQLKQPVPVQRNNLANLLRNDSFQLRQLRQPVPVQRNNFANLLRNDSFQLRQLRQPIAVPLDEDEDSSNESVAVESSVDSGFTTLSWTNSTSLAADSDRTIDSDIGFI